MSARSTFCLQIWPRLVALYAQSGIGALCLSLQDTFDADVPVLLFFVLADAAGEGLSRADAERLVDAAAEWRTLAVLPLRRMRVALKDHATTPELQAFRTVVKATELEAERLAVAKLAALFEPLSGPADLAAAYLSRLGVPTATSGAALALLRSGAQSVSSYTRTS